MLYYLSGRSLWIDEARLALNVAGRGYAGLLRPLDYDQAASPLFLWGEKLVTQLLGVNERAFWLLPLIAGLATVALFVPVARRFLPGWPGVLVASSLCIAPTLIHFSATAKPYIGDLAFALAMILGTAAWIERPRSRLARALPLIGVLAAWGSAPAIFTLIPAGAALLLGAPRERRGRAVLLLGLWLAAFGAAYAVVYGASAHSDYLQGFWRHAFVTPGEPQFESRLGGVRRDIFTAFSVGLYDPPTVALTVPEWFTQAQRFGSWLLAVVAAIGAARLIQARARWESVLLFGPVVLLGVASALSRYPASTRLVLFLVPVFYLCVAAGASALIARACRRRAGGWRVECSSGWFSDRSS